MPNMNPFPGPNSVLVLDNASIHKDGYLKRILEGQGMRLLFLPPYSPYLNPIELDFNTIKSYIRRHYRSARCRPVHTLHRALANMVDVDVTNWMERVGHFEHIHRL